MSSDRWAALLRSATGLSAVCDCCISWSYSLNIFTLDLPLTDSTHFNIDFCKKAIWMDWFLISNEFSWMLPCVDTSRFAFSTHFKSYVRSTHWQRVQNANSQYKYASVSVLYMYGMGSATKWNIQPQVLAHRRIQRRDMGAGPYPWKIASGYRLP